MAQEAKKKVDNLVGKKLGDYKLIDKLATGGMAKIYIGEDVKLGRKVALKVLTEDMLEADSTLTERFQREAKAVANLDHNNIVPIYQYGEEDELYFLAMKLIEGEDLADELNRLNRQKKLVSVKRMLSILDQVAAALDYAHAKGIIHRDVKPSNILLDANGKAYLTDFGLVLRQQVDQTMGTAFGTPRYISPEQALASEKSVPQSDIYSLAVIVYEMVTGSMVFKADTAMQVALSHISEPPPPPRVINPEIPRGVEREILKALEKSPEDRHKSARAFINAIRDAYGDAVTDEEADSPEVVSTKTPVMRPPEMDKAIEQHISRIEKIKGLDGSDTVPASEPSRPPKVGSAPIPAPAEKKKRRPTSRLFVFVLFVSILALAGSFALALSENNSGGSSNNSDNDNDSAVVTNPTEVEDSSNAAAPTVETEIPVEPTIQLLPGTLYYNSLVFALRNDSKDPIDLRTVSIIREDGSDVFNEEDMSALELEQGQCLLVISTSGQSEDVDEAWKCEEDSPTPHNRPSAALFWRVSADSETFEVMIEDEVVATCEAIAAGRSGSCAVELPLSEEN